MIINIKDEYIKLDQLLKFSGIAESGSDAKLLIKDEQIKLNGIICLERGKKVRRGDIVSFGEQDIYVR